MYPPIAEAPWGGMFSASPLGIKVLYTPTSVLCGRQIILIVEMGVM